MREDDVFKRFLYHPGVVSDETKGGTNSEAVIDLFVEVFEVRGLRRQAIVILLQNLFGDTVERRVGDALRDACSGDRMCVLMETMTTRFFPDGVWKVGKTRTEDEKTRTMNEAFDRVARVFPEIFGGVVGRAKARKGAARVGVFLNGRMNRVVVYRVFEEVFGGLFPRL